MIAPGTYVVVEERFGWKSFTLYPDGVVRFVDARDDRVSTWRTQSPDGATWLSAMGTWLARGDLRKEGS